MRYTHVLPILTFYHHLITAVKSYTHQYVSSIPVEFEFYVMEWSRTPGTSIMPPKASKSRLQMSIASARAKKAENNDQECLETSGDAMRVNYNEALERIKCLEAQLAVEQEKASELSSSLVNAEAKASQLSQELAHERHKYKEVHKELVYERQRYKELYKELRVERRARQRNKAKKESLVEQINLLHSAAVESSKSKKELMANASGAIQSLLGLEKQNLKLRSELSLCLERSKKEFQSWHQEQCVMRKKLRKANLQVHRLKKKCNMATVHKEYAVTRAKEQLLKQKSTHRLLKKGVYTEDTRNLIRFLVNAGCSKDYVGQVIAAVLKSAGITAVGALSRRTVS